jgi:TorA maturation chaperone TorD
METEDHVSYVFEVMRYLIAGDDAGTCNLEQQRRFFRAHVQTWVERLCDAVKPTRARALGAVAAFTRAFVEVETQGFDLLEA